MPERDAPSAALLNAEGLRLLEEEKPEAALARFAEALELVVTDRRARAALHENCADAWLKLGQREFAQRARVRAIHLWDDAADRRRAADARSRLGAELVAAGSAAEALVQLGWAARELDRLGARKEAAWARLRLGLCWRALGRRGRARRELLAALRRFRRLAVAGGSPVPVAAALEALAELDLEDERVEAAERRAHESLTWCRRADARPDGRRQRAKTLACLSRVQHIRGRQVEAQRAGEEAAAIMRGLDDVAGEVAALAHLMALTDDDGELEQLEERAFERLEALRVRTGLPSLRQDLFATVAPAFKLRAANLVLAGRYRDALVQAERSTARTAVDALAGRAIAADDRETATLGAVGLAEIARDILGNTRALLSYVWDHERCYAIAASVDGILGWEVGESTEIADLVAAFVAAVRDGEPDDGAGRQLSALLLAPGDGILGQRDLLIAADGALHGVPFGALPPCDRGYDYLVEGCAVAYAPSATFVLGLRTRSRERPPFRVRLAGWCAPGLLYGERELAEVKAMLGAAGEEPVCVIAREDARSAPADVVPAEGAEVVHFISHSAGDDRAHDQTALVIESLEGGTWRAQAIEAANLPTSLAYLSTCSGARGQAVRGEGSVGLARAFLLAGATAVVAPLWPIYGSHAAPFATAFYRGLCQGASVADALRAAMRRAVETGWDTRHWAPFGVYGDGFGVALPA